MAQQHLDRLTAVDASFLHQEGPTSHMHVGGLSVFEGPPPAMDEFLEGIRSRLHLVPRYRHKLAHTALDSGRPVWVDDPNFNLEYHVRHTALPAPAGRASCCGWPRGSSPRASTAPSRCGSCGWSRAWRATASR